MFPPTHPALDKARRAYESGSLEVARDLCEQVLAKGRKNPPALYLMGQILHAMRRYDDAAAPLEQCARLQPKESLVHLMLGFVNTEQGKFSAALSRFDKVLKLKPKSVDAIQGKAEVFDRKGDHTKVMHLLKPLISASDETAEMAFNYARALKNEKRIDEAITLIRKHADSPNATSKTRRRLLFELGRILEKNEQYDDAFLAYQQANQAEAIVYDPEAYHRRLDDLITVYSEKNLASYPRATHGSDVPVLIVGMPRTGSTLVEHIIDAHPHTFGVGEVPLLPDVCSSLSLTIGSTEPYPFCIPEMTVEDANRAGKRYVDSLRKLGRGAKRIIDKDLLNYENLGLLSLIVPEAYVLDCRRDPMDTCISCFMNPLFTTGHPYATDLHNLGLRYREYERIMAHWEGVLQNRVLKVQYEELIADQEEMSRRIIDFIGLPWDDRCLRFHESKRDALTLSREQVRQPIYTTSVKRADRFAAHLEPLRKALEKRN